MSAFKARFEDDADVHWPNPVKRYESAARATPLSNVLQSASKPDRTTSATRKLLLRGLDALDQQSDKVKQHTITQERPTTEPAQGSTADPAMSTVESRISHKYSSYSMWRAAPAGIVAHMAMGLKHWLASLSPRRPQLSECSGPHATSGTLHAAAPVEISRTVVLPPKQVDQFQQGYTMASEEVFSTSKPHATRNNADAVQQVSDQPGQLQADKDKEIPSTLDTLDSATSRGHKSTKAKHNRAD